MAMLAALCEAVDARPYMRGHGARVGQLAEAVAIRLGWNPDRIRRLRIGALLHDVGKLAVAGEIWSKPGRLSDFELAEIRRHPAAGMHLLSGLPDFRFAIPIVLFHHERWDGRGYPFGRSARAIPLEARVLAVADAFDAMTSPRPYGPPVSRAQAFAEIGRCAGSQFDPAVVETFSALGTGLAAEPLAADG